MHFSKISPIIIKDFFATLFPQKEEDTEAEAYLAYLREVKVTPTSYGGGTEGVNIPFTVDFDGAWVKGTVTAESVKDGQPVFTEGEAL